MTASGNLVTYPARWKLARLACGSLLHILAGLALLLIRDELPVPLWALVLVALFQVGFFSFGLSFAVGRLLRPRPVLTIGDEGIYDAATVWAVGLVPWGEIRQVIVYDFARERFLGIRLRNPAAFFEQQGPVQRLLYRIHGRLVPAPINIPQVLLPLPADDLQHQIQRQYGHRLQ